MNKSGFQAWVFEVLCTARYSVGAAEQVARAVRSFDPTAARLVEEHTAAFRRLLAHLESRGDGLPDHVTGKR